MNSKDIRNSFIRFFEEKNHKYIRSAPVVPIEDPTLLFTNAGMNQFKPIFLEQVKPDNKRAVNSQKCIRVSGKHNDLEEVGVDSFHHTFFEMLGNWSFGDYYKKEAIQWAWELITVEWKLDKNRLWVTVFEEDDEAFELWTKETNIDPSRVIRSGKKDNFWEMGDTGPCGPCSEIHYYVGLNLEDQTSSGVNTIDDYWELWNLVFIQSNRLSDGTLEPLPSKHVDTGAGLERISAVIQGKNSNYETDLFFPIIEEISAISGQSYEDKPIPHKVIADHIRMLCFSIADGAIPSNEGRGYVLRRILRRACRFGRDLHLKQPFLYKLVPVVGEIMGEVFNEVVEKRSHIENIIKLEEEAFNKTLDRGLNHFEKIIENMKGSRISGSESFKLYDTYGFPLDLTQLIARERGFTVDEEGFVQSMNRQKEIAKNAGKFKIQKEKLDWKILSDIAETKFLGYDTLKSSSEIVRYAFDENNVFLILDQTPFYAESGGQVSDVGIITGDGTKLEVLDVKKENNYFIHICKGTFKKTSALTCEIDGFHRSKIKSNHTATHLMHKALKKTLGDHVNQAGSLVHSEYLRFDLTHSNKITSNEIFEIETLVNEQILKNNQLHISIETFEEAKKNGAEALFGEKYGDNVRVVKVGDFSMELCGGTHVERTGDIGSFKIIEESSLSSGVRRIVAVTGLKSILQMQQNESTLSDLQSVLKTPPRNMLERISTLLKDKKELERKLKSKASIKSEIKFLDEIIPVGRYKMLVKKVSHNEIEDLKSFGDKIYDTLDNGIAVVFLEGEEKPSAVIVVSKELNKEGIFAGILAKEIGGFMGGGGGGKPHLATAGGKSNNQIDDAIKNTEKLIIEILKR